MQEGNNHPTIPAMGTFETADGHINIGVLGDFEPAAQLLGIAAVLEDERFATHEMRLVHRHALDEEIAQALKRRTTHEWIERLAEHFPAGPVYRVPEVFEDPQVQHLGLAETVELADGRPVRVLRHPVTLTATPASIRTGPPDPGQHTAEVLAELDRTV
jgi:crotonobetainyl-CoA:carnitine CoA-transferase CaiB-like acyl-CoA transferase